MTEVVYEIVEHDGGWAYKLGDVFSETFASRALAEEAADIVATEQQRPGETAAISYQDPSGEWHEELSHGEDRPLTHVDEAGQRLR